MVLCFFENVFYLPEKRYEFDLLTYLYELDGSDGMCHVRKVRCWDVRCLEYRMVRICVLQYVECLSSEIMSMWDIRDVWNVWDIGYLESTISGMWYAEVVRCFGCRMLEMCGFRDVEYSRFRMFGMCDTGDVRY